MSHHHQPPHLSFVLSSSAPPFYTSTLLLANKLNRSVTESLHHLIKSSHLGSSVVLLSPSWPRWMYPLYRCDQLYFLFFFSFFFFFVCLLPLCFSLKDTKITRRTLIYIYIYQSIVTGWCFQGMSREDSKTGKSRSHATSIRVYISFHGISSLSSLLIFFSSPLFLRLSPVCCFWFYS